MKKNSVNSIRKNRQPAEKFNRKKLFTKIVAGLLAAIFIFGNLPGLKIEAAGIISGRVFQDFNGNGNYDDGGIADSPTAVDVGVVGVTVTAYDSTGTAQGTTTTIAGANAAELGTYTLNAGGTGPYRLEFTGLPAGFQPSARNTNSLNGGTDRNSGSTVQFVANGTTANVNLAINRPEDYCQNNPNLATCRFNRGAQNSTGNNGVSGNPALQSFPYDAGTVYTDTVVGNYDDPTTHTTNVTASQIGSVFSLAYSRVNKRIYAAAYFKRYVGFGSGANGNYSSPPSTTTDDAGAIYVINPADSTVVSRFTVPNATTNNHSDAAAADTTNASWDAIGKTSLGGMAMADDEARLFVMNLENRTLYALNPTTGASLDSQLVPTPADCPTANNVRPFAVKYYRGNVYVGMVCSAEGSTAANLRAYVYQVDPSTLDFNTTSFYSVSLNYNRGNVNDPAGSHPAEWRPWVPTIQNGFAYPQPMLTDIEFDNGSMVLGIRDRHGDQGDDSSVRPGGETLRACGSFTSTNFPGSLTLEANGRCGGNGTAPQNTGQGPGAAPGTATGSGEFYFQDDFSNPANGANYHDEVSLGTTAHLPGHTQTITSVYDPISRIISDQTFDGGFRWLNDTSGATDRAYRLFNDEEPIVGEFGKANGLGDVIPLCDSAPIEIGNRVWRDANSNGVQDPQESRAGSNYISLQGITVGLYASNAATTPIATTLTDQDGEYYFSSAPGTNTTNAIYNLSILPNTAYQIRFGNAADFQPGGDLAGLILTTANATQQAGFDDASDSDAISAATGTGTVPVINFTTGAAGANDHTLDAGFVTLSVGSTVFNDADNDGVFDSGESGIGGVTVELLYDANNNGQIDTAEANAPLLTTTTSTDTGSVGNYYFGGLAAGNYQVRIPTPPATATLSSSAGVTDTLDNREDNDDNGAQAGGAGGATVSPIINLAVNAEPAGNGTTGTESGQGGAQDDADDDNGDMTVDFGFTALVSIGSNVFLDRNNDGTQDADGADNTLGNFDDESGIGSVAVQLFYDANNDGSIAGAEDTTAYASTTTGTTAGSVGNYFFGGLPPGRYQVRIPTTNFAAGNALLRTPASSTTTATTDNNVDGNDDGAQTAVGAVVTSPLIVLTDNGEVTTETFAGSAQDDADDNNGNMTVDFGFVPTAALGSSVFLDRNNDGVQDADGPDNNSATIADNETGIPGVTVQLFYDADNSGILIGAEDTTVVAARTTDADGNYYFGGLVPGNYQIRIPATNFTGAGALVNTVNSSVVTDTADNQQDGDDNGTQVGASAVTTSPLINLTLNGEPTNPTNETFSGGAQDDADDNDGDMTVDFGFVPTASIGSSVFLDRNNNGVQNPGGADNNILTVADNETGISGVTVELSYDANNDGDFLDTNESLAGTTTTDSTGDYFFGNLTPGRYRVRIPVANFTGSGGLVNAQRSSTDIATSGGDNQQDGDDNGTQSSIGGETLSPIIILTLNGEPTNPTNELFSGGTADGVIDDNDGDMTVDFGFVSATSLGNFVFADTDRDGVQDTGELGISGVRVRLFSGATEINVGPDGILGTADDAANGMLTDASGNYNFQQLAAGTYTVRFELPTGFGYRFSPANQGANDETDSDVTVPDTNSPRVGVTGSYALTVGNSNTTVDAGVVQTVSIGNQVFNDANNNGVRDGAEVGIGSVAVKLYIDADGDGTPENGGNPVATTTTPTGTTGLYLFSGLAPSTYIVAVVTPSGYVSSTINAGDPDTDADDNDDNGVITSVVETRSHPVTLTLTGEPSGENPDNDTDTPTGAENLTVDFAFRASVATAVELDKFDVYTDGASVELRWTTGSETGNLGFNVYRETGGKRHLLNAAPIAGNALRSSANLQASGGEYVWTVKETVPHAVYYLEDLDVDGGATLHGAVSPQYRASLDRQPNARTFNDLANDEGSVSLIESVGNLRTANPKGDKATAATAVAAAAMARQRQIAAAGGAKITIKRDGWHRVSAQQLQATGFDTNTDPQFWQLYADGAEVPFKLNSNSIEFFGRALDTPLTDRRAYYLVRAQTAGQRINAVEGGGAGETVGARSFGVTVERKDRQVYVSSLLNGDADNWFGAVVSRNIETVQSLNAVNVDGNGQARLSVKLQGVVAGEHLVSVRFNDAQLGTVEFAGFENKEFEFDLPASAVREGANRVVMQANGAGSDASLVDAIRLKYQRGYVAQNDQLRFIVPANQTVLVGGFTDENISVYEIIGGAARRQILAAAETFTGSYGFSLGATNEDREMIAVVNSSVGPAAVENNAPSAWFDARNAADFVIVTADELQTSAANLAAMRQNQGLRTKVVLIEDLFDEFTFGRRDPHAVKEFLRTATTAWQTKPGYALLFGDASYDARNNLGLAQTRDLVPTKLVDTEFMETSSDAWLADFNDDGAEDIALGRLPIGDAAEAAAAVLKLARFDSQGARQEKTNVLVADNGFADYSQALQTLLPSEMNSLRIDRGALSDAETHGLIVEHLNRNPLLVTYTGHGSQSVWATNGIFNANDAAALSNTQLSFYLLMNCLNGYTNQPTGESLAETLFRNPHGAIAVWTSSGITNPGEQGAISRAFTRLAFNAVAGKSLRVGDVAKAAKRAATDADVRRTWQLVGDPTVFVR